MAWARGTDTSFRAPDDVQLRPAQNACGWFFFIMAALFVVQTLLGGASEHYRAELQSFFGIDLGRILPFNVVRTWHLQLSIFWVATSYLAAGIFLVPMIAGREPKGQNLLAYGLLGALVIVVVGSLLGEWSGIYGLIRNSGIRVAGSWATLADSLNGGLVLLGHHSLSWPARAAL
jgi:nitric oxide reductase subunit B